MILLSVSYYLTALLDGRILFVFFVVVSGSLLFVNGDPTKHHGGGIERFLSPEVALYVIAARAYRITMVTAVNARANRDHCSN